MNKSLATFLLSWFVFVGVTIYSFSQHLPYVVYSPGSTVDLLRPVDKKLPVRINNAKTYPTSGSLRMLTVAVTNPEPSYQPNIFTVLIAWLDDSQSVYRREVIYPETTTTDAERDASMAQMTNSQDGAAAAAVRALGKPVKEHAQIIWVKTGGAADGALQIRDQILKINGRRVSDFDSIKKTIQALPIGKEARLRVVRRDEKITVKVKTAESEIFPGKAALDVYFGTGFAFPDDLQINYQIDERIGGPSAGMMLALTTYDLLTPGELTAGKSIAGTGTIDEKGKIGPIGGLPQKLAAAEQAGAKLFLLPAGNCSDWRSSEYRPTKMKVTRVEKLTDAIKAIKLWAKDPLSKLPECGKNE